MSELESQRPIPLESGSLVPPGGLPPTAVGADTPQPPEPEGPHIVYGRPRYPRRRPFDSLLSAAVGSLRAGIEAAVKFASKLGRVRT